MRKWLHSPWTTLTLAIVALSIGYTVYIQKTGIAAASMFCPSQQALDKKS